MIYKGFSSLYLTSPTPYQKKKKKSKKIIFIFIYEYKCIYQTMFAYFTELARWVGGTTGLVVSYVKGLLFGDDPADSSITETPVHRQADETIEEVVDNDIEADETSLALDEVVNNNIEADETSLALDGVVDNETQPIVTVTETSSALDGVVRSYIVEVDRPTDPISFMRLVKPKVLDELFRRETKVYMDLECVMMKVGVADGVEDTDDAHFRTKCQKLLNEFEYENLYDEMVETILLSFAKYQRNGSGWRLKYIKHLYVKVSLNKPLKGGVHISLPKKLKKTRELLLT